jgi:hypothetical protein
MRRYPPRREEGPGLLVMLLMFMLGAVAVLAVLGVIFWPQIYPALQERFGPPPPPSQANETPPQPAGDLGHYLRLKNVSCQTLSHDFLIVTDDVSEGTVSGLVAAMPEEEDAAASIASSYDFNQTTRTYVKGQEMKKVLVQGSLEHTTIWKDGRIYQCNPECTMHLLGDEGWQEYLDTLSSMRSDCAYLGRTSLPGSVNISRLVSVQNTGRREIGGFRCEDFLITPDKGYAASLLNGTSLDDDQRSLLGVLVHLDGPLEECLDDGIGVIVYRNLTLDLSNSYRFDYSPGGGMFVNQQTSLTYFSDEVPESFLFLPEQG